MDDQSPSLRFCPRKYKFKLKGSDPILVHFGMDVFCDPYGVLCLALPKYLDKVFANYECMLKNKNAFAQFGYTARLNFEFGYIPR
jgi:hypothetical protein